VFEFKTAWVQLHSSCSVVRSPCHTAGYIWINFKRILQHFELFAVVQLMLLTILLETSKLSLQSVPIIVLTLIYSRSVSSFNLGVFLRT